MKQDKTTMASKAESPHPEVSAIASLGLIPKRDIQADSFVESNPEYDGRGVVAAIFDTGIDPGAVGLQVCPDGRPKVLDVLDCTGSGDVNTETVAKPEKTEEGDAAVVINGLTGRKLRLNPAWVNPSGEYRVGTLSGYRVFSSDLVKRLKSDRQEEWDKTQLRAIEAAHRELAAFDAKNPDPSSSPALLAQRQSLSDALSTLQALKSSYSDPGPVYDVVAFFDGSKWRAAVDTSERGDLTDAVAFTNFVDERQWGTFSQKDLCNYCINLYDDGNLVSVVVAAGSHGTHVAGIVGAYDPQHPEMSGVAPGTQIICCKIGDSRLGSMESALGMERAVNAVIRNKVDIINMSYGEPVKDPSSGRVVNVIRELIRRHGVIFVTSAGNAGPALGTVGAPASSCSSDVIAVGAYVSPSMLEAQYSLKNTLPAVNYSWSSRGPTKLATTGVSICAPGGAISSVPTWTLKRNQHMNGTSMASPNACGGICLILSGLKAKGVEYNPIRIRRAVENTAHLVPGVERLSQGCGLLQVTAAFQHVVDYQHNKAFGLKINVRSNGLLGVHLREPHEVCNRSRHATKVYLNPGYHPDAPQASKVAFDTQIALVSAKTWFSVPAYYHFGNGRGFELSVDLDGARRSEPESDVHYGEVLGFDSSLPREAGPLVRVPITYLSPSAAPLPTPSAALVSAPLRHEFPGLTLSPGQIHRKVVHVPSGASRFTVTLRPSGSWGGGDQGANNRILVVHCLQLLPQRAYRETNTEQYVYFNRATTKTVSGSCQPGFAMEVVIAQYNLSNVGDSSVDVEVTFSGVQAHVPSFSSGLVLEVKEGFRRLDISAPEGAATQHLSPSATLTHVERALHPEQFSIGPVTERTEQTPISRNEPTADGHPMYQLDLKYSFSVESPGIYSLHAGALSETLYENPFGAQMRIVHDANGRIVGAADAWSNANPTEKLEKGKYTVRMALRHTSVSTLEDAKTTPIKLRRKLGSSININAFTSLPGLLGNFDRASRVAINGGETVPLFFKAPVASAKALGKDVSAGCSLVGDLKLLHKGDIDGSYPDKLPLRLIVCAVASKPPSEAAADSRAKAEKKRIAKAKEELEKSGGQKKPEDHSVEALERKIIEVKIKHLEATAKDVAKRISAALLPPNKDGSSGSGSSSVKEVGTEAAIALQEWHASYDKLREAVASGGEELQGKLLDALLTKEQTVLLAAEKAAMGSEHAPDTEGVAALVRRAQQTKDAVNADLQFAEVAVALARKKPDANNVAASEAYRVAEKKQGQLFQADCLHVRALHLQCVADDSKEASRVALDEALENLKTSNLASSDEKGEVKAITLLAHIASGRSGTVLKMTSDALKAIEQDAKAEDNLPGLDRAFLVKAFNKALAAVGYADHWTQRAAVVEALRKPTVQAKL